MDLSRSTAVRTPGPIRSGRREDALAIRLPVLRAVLERQLRFRREQLARLDECGEALEASDGAESADDRVPVAARAVREVDALVAAGARRALNDIEVALDRMRAGRYGHCRSCGGRIPLAVLEAIPKTTVCLTCQARRDRWGDQQMPGAVVRTAAPTGG
jgi:RNA polymerase-binding transcription factor